ncbi:MAG: hypothetical protein NUV56_01970, partial [Candidatus Uhrbacteria bacterium]|nr:hypothetical protein [Candidatus Uhrbacteria bacterium]
SPITGAVATMQSDVGIDLPPERFTRLTRRHITLDEGTTRSTHEYFLVEWKPEDGPFPEIVLPRGAAAHAFFAAHRLPERLSFRYDRGVLLDLT